MKKTLIRAFSLCLALVLLTGLLVPYAGAIEYSGIPPMNVEATAALLIDMDSDQILYEQNADEKRYPASITKVMTALLTLEAVGRGELSMDTVVTCPAEALADVTKDSSTANIVAGEQMTVTDLLYCLMLPSANEAANTLAITVAGDIPAFVERMNQRAQELGMEGTHFANPHGLHNPDHYTTARDIYKMAKQAMTHSAFREIVSTASYTTAATNMAGPRQLFNTNGLLTRLKYPGYTCSGTIGIKTGSTGEAGYCLVAAAKRKGTTLVSVVLGAQNPETNGNVQHKQFSESKRLIEWGFDNFSATTLLDADTYLEEIPVRFSLEASHAVLQPVQSVKTLVPGEYNPERLELRLHLDHDTASAPIAAGDVLGTVTVIYDGEEYATVDMAAVSDIGFSPFMAFVSSVNTVLGNLYVRLLLLLAVILLIVGVIRRFEAQRHEARKAARQQRQEQKRQQALARHRKEEREARRKQEQARRARERKEREASWQRPPERRSPTAQDERRRSAPPNRKRDHRPNNRNHLK